MIEIGTRVAGSTLFSTFTGVVYDYKPLPINGYLYVVLLDGHPEDAPVYVAVDSVTPITEAQT